MFQTLISIENSIVIQTKFGAAVVERVADGFFVARLGAEASSTGRTAEDAAIAAARVFQNLIIIERENY